MAVTNVAIPSGSVKLFEGAIALLKEWGWGPYLVLKPDWKKRSNGHRQPQVQSAIMIHHTGGAATSTDYLLNPTDRPKLKLLANTHVRQHAKQIVILAAGPASHAGNGTKANYDKAVAGRAPLTANMVPKRPDGTFSANRYTVGVEVDGVGGANEWNAWTRQAVIAVATAFNIAGGWAEGGKTPRALAHKEFTVRKPGDPYMNMGAFRAAVKSAIVTGKVSPFGTPPVDTPPVLGDRVLSKDGIDSGPDVAELAALLTAQGYDVGKPLDSFGPMMDKAVRDFQTKAGLEVDGKVGPLTVAALKGETLPEPQPEPELPDPPTVPTPDEGTEEPSEPPVEPPVTPEPEPPAPTPEPPKPPTGPSLPAGAVIIVAGSANKPGGGQSGKQKRRLDVALKYLNANPSSKIVVTGGVKPGRGSKSEAEEARLYLVGKGIASSRIIKEGTSGSTYGNFVNGLPFAKKAGAKSIFIISDFSHMRRCVSLAYAANKRQGTGLPISGVDWYKDGDRQDATVSQAAQQARVAWSGMTEELVRRLDSRWKITSARMIRRGDRGEDVKALQKKIGVTADGIFGPNTEKAVKAFQKKNGLTADGIVGPKTQTALNK